MNPNVRSCLALCLLSGVADSLWSGTVIAAFVLISSGGSNTTVGIVEAAQGLATLLFALPIGYVADTHGRSVVIAAGGVLTIAAAVATCAVVIHVEHAGGLTAATTRYFIGLMALWGAVGGVINGPAQALYADSIPTGRRSAYYVYLFATYIGASAVGPAIAVAIFARTGDTWTLGELRGAIFAGMACEVATGLVMFTFRDSAALGAESEALLGSASPEPAPAESALDQACADGRVPQPPPLPDSRRLRLVPYVLFSSGLLTALGAGMTVKFFPLFFFQNLHLSPLHVQLIYVAVPLAMVAASVAVQRLSRAVGRIEMIVAGRTLGVTLLVTMGWLQLHAGYGGFALVPIYVLRTALMNAGYPLEESVLMDVVPKGRRARWKALEAVSQFGWCGSAAVGGYLGDRFGYPFTFLITAAIQGAATVLCATLIGAVGAERRDALPTTGDDLREPLLAAAAAAPATTAVGRPDGTTE